MERNVKFFKGILLILIVGGLWFKPLNAGIISVKGLVLCEKVANAGGRFSFFNIKDKLYYNKDFFPTTAQFESPIVMVARRKVKAFLKAAIIDSNGNVVTEMPTRLITVKDYPTFFLISWKKVIFKKPGKYFIRIYVNRKILYIYPVIVQGI